MTAPQFPVLYYPTFEPSADWFRTYLLFFDQIQTIVPEGVKFNPSDKISRVIELEPEAFITIPPQPNDVWFDDVNLVRLEKAFREIARHEPAVNQETVSIEIATDGSFRIPGVVGLHHSKTTPNIRKLLEKYNLLRPELEDLYGQRGEYLPANEAASNLLLSHIADKIGKRSGVAT